MSARTWFALPLAGAVLFLPLLGSPALACCPAPPSGKPVVNADQTVIIIWDAARKVQHFIRKATFKSAADDFGFLVPTPTVPDLQESGNEAFPYLQKLTEPETKTVSTLVRDMSCACGKKKEMLTKGAVRVRVEKDVAGFHAAVLETQSADALVKWLKENGYAYSEELKAWAQPYLEKKWMITALKVAKDKDGKGQQDVGAAALRMSFQTDRPLFPYREPDSRSAAETLEAKRRLLRIYFLAEARYQGEMTPDHRWTGYVAWANPLTAEDRKKVLKLLRLPPATGPAEWWLTEFEDYWPYEVAPADVYFSRDPKQDTRERPPIIQYAFFAWPTDVMVYALAGFIVLLVVVRLFRRKAGPQAGSPAV
jgi:hypothetical protein